MTYLDVEQELVCALYSYMVSYAYAHILFIVGLLSPIITIIMFETTGFARIRSSVAAELC